MDSLTAREVPPILAELVAAHPADRLVAVQSLRTPLERAGLTTFLHIGEAESVEVRHFMARFPTLPPMEKVADGVHHVTVRLPEGMRFEYMIAPTVDGEVTEHLDPSNPYRATDPFGSHSVAFGPGYLPPLWATATPARPGALRPGFVDSAAYGARRRVQWYRPAGHPGRLPLLVVHDGSDFVNHAGLIGVLDNLIEAGTVPAFAAALIDSGDRLTEYTNDRRQAEFILEVVDAAVRRNGAERDPAAHVYLGASLGGVAALAGAWQTHPVAGLVLLSGSFVTALGGDMNRGEQFSPIVDFMEQFTARSGRPADRIFQACGMYEGLTPDNRVFTPILQATGADVLYHESPDGHHWQNWRDQLAAALAHTVPTGSAGTVRP